MAVDGEGATGFVGELILVGLFFNFETKLAALIEGGFKLLFVFHLIRNAKKNPFVNICIKIILQP